MNLVYTNIQHAFRKEHNLSCNEYVLCDMIYFLSNSAASSVPGWCYLSKENLADNIGLSKQAVLTMIERMIEHGFLIKNDQTKYLKTSAKWQESYHGKETLPPVTGKETLPNLFTNGKETLPDSGKETLPHNYNVNNNIHITIDKIKKDKENLFTELTAYKTNFPTKYPYILYEQFFAYWTELNRKKTRMRLNEEKFFDIGKRLATFWRNVSDQNKNKYWQLHKEQLTDNGVKQPKQQPAEVG